MLFKSVVLLLEGGGEGEGVEALGEGVGVEGFIIVTIGVIAAGAEAVLFATLVLLMII